MKRSTLNPVPWTSALGLAVVAVTLAAAPAVHAQTSSPRKHQPGKVKHKAQAPTGAKSANEDVTILYRLGRPIGLGFALRGDNRVVTALSNLSRGSDHLKLRSSRGAMQEATVTYRDAARGLALLTPQGRHTWGGMAAAGNTPDMKHLRVFLRVGSRAQSRPVKLLANPGNRGVELLPIPDAPVSALGAPVVTESGRALGVVVQACSPKKPNGALVCAGPTLLASVRAVRRVVKAAGIGQRRAPTGVKVTGSAAPIPRGLRVVAVEPGSNMARAGIHGPTKDRPGDVILAVDGQPITSEVQLTRALGGGAQQAKGKDLLIWRWDRFVTRKIHFLQKHAKQPKPKTLHH